MKKTECGDGKGIFYLFCRFSTLNYGLSANNLFPDISLGFTLAQVAVIIGTVGTAGTVDEAIAVVGDEVIKVQVLCRCFPEILIAVVFRGLCVTESGG